MTEFSLPIWIVLMLIGISIVRLGLRAWKKKSGDMAIPLIPRIYIFGVFFARMMLWIPGDHEMSQWARTAIALVFFSDVVLGLLTSWHMTKAQRELGIHLYNIFIQNVKESVKLEG